MQTAFVAVVIFGAARLMFKSFPVLELLESMRLNHRAEDMRMAELHATLEKGRHIIPDDRGRVVLGDKINETAERHLRQALIHGRRRTMLRRAVVYGLSCLACQSAWLGLALGLSCGHGWLSLLDACGYAGASAIIARIVDAPSCGGKR